MTRVKGIKLTDKLVENYIRDSYGATNLLNKSSVFNTCIDATATTTNSNTSDELHKKLQNLNNLCVNANDLTKRKLQRSSGDNFSSLMDNINHTMEVMNQYSTDILDLSSNTTPTTVPTANDTKDNEMTSTSSNSVSSRSRFSVSSANDDFNIDSLTSEFSTVTLQALDIPQKVHNANKFIFLTNSDGIVTRINCLFKTDDGDLESIVHKLTSIKASAT